jgi:hypothetical protein
LAEPDGRSDQELLAATDPMDWIRPGELKKSRGAATF